MFRTTHVCAFKERGGQSDSELGCIDRLKRKLRRSTLISPNHPYTYHYFKSELSVRQEQKRQLALGRWTIHPFSSFRKWYDMYLIFLYLSVLYTKPAEASFMTSIDDYNEMTFFKEYVVITDVLCWVDIMVNFVTGYFVKGPNTVELRRSSIAKRYILSPFFICDVLSSIPKALVFYYYPDRSSISKRLIGFLDIVCFLKAVRLLSVLIYADRMARSVRQFRGTIFLMGNIVLCVIVVHWMACLQFGITMLTRFYFWTDQKHQTWISRLELQDKPVFQKYVLSFFRSSAYILGVRIASIYQEQLPEEYIVAVFTYIIGKILVILTWTTLAVAILNSRSVNIKLAEIINQLDEYMKQKQLPLNLQERISHYYTFKYQKKYFREELVMDNLSYDEVTNLIRFLEPEIYLPNDRVLISGDRGNAMYFLSSGTVAVYTRSGKEVCHLQDGMYFGEASLILKGKRTVATVVAIEPCRVYKLSRRNFEQCLLNNPTVLEKLTRNAEDKVNKIMAIEENYWKTLFEESHLPPGVDSHTSNRI
ncbi:hypothetical protein NQ318_016963, partial [Aromia moschata]